MKFSLPCHAKYCNPQFQGGKNNLFLYDLNQNIYMQANPANVMLISHSNQSMSLIFKPYPYFPEVHLNTKCEDSINSNYPKDMTHQRSFSYYMLWSRW